MRLTHPSLGEVLGEADSVEEWAGGQAESARKSGVRLTK